MKAMQEKLYELLKTLPKNAKTEKQEVVALLAQVAQKMKELRKEANEANEIARHIEGHYKWKNAIKAIFGQEGMDKCIAWMEYDAELQRSKIYQDALDDRINIGGALN